AALRPSRRTLGVAAPWLAAAALYLGYLAFVGGDSMPWGRTLIPLLAIAVTLSAVAMDDAPVGAPARVGGRLRGALVGAAVAAQIPVLFSRPPQYEDGSAPTGPYVGLFLESVLP